MPSIKGLDLGRDFFRECGEPMLKEEFPDLIPHLCCGLFGSGSECFGFDDDISQDHDFEPGFCIFLPDENVVDRKQAFRLERAYAGLPREFRGFKRSVMQPVGGARHGVFRTSEFFYDKIGSADGQLDREAWLYVPEQSLAECTNGEIFFDNPGTVTAIRSALSKMPEDVRKKKLAAQLFLMAQSGQYNYGRCLRHGESAAAQLAVCEFVKSTLSVIFLLNRTYQPYYKWTFRALRSLPVLAESGDRLAALLESGNGPDRSPEKIGLIESLAQDVIDELVRQDLTRAACGDLEKHAYSVNDLSADPDLRNRHILAAL